MTPKEDADYVHTDGSYVVGTAHEGGGNSLDIGLHHYSEDGERMAYYRFRVPDKDEPLAHYQYRDDGKRPPDAVIAAIHSRGWEAANVSYSDPRTHREMPDPIRLLDMRDAFREMASQYSDGDYLRIYFRSLARGSEQLAVTVATLLFEPDIDSASDIDGYMKESMGKLPGSGRDLNSIRELVEGNLINVADPSTVTRTAYSDRAVEDIEEMRRSLRLDDSDGSLTLEEWKDMVSNPTDYVSDEMREKVNRRGSDDG